MSTRTNQVHMGQMAREWGWDVSEERDDITVVFTSTEDPEVEMEVNHRGYVTYQLTFFNSHNGTVKVVRGGLNQIMSPSEVSKLTPEV